MGARVRVIAPPTLIPAAMERLGVEVFHDMRAGLADCDIVMMLRLQRERMEGSFVPSVHEYFHFYGLDYDKLSHAKPDALIMHLDAKFHFREPFLDFGGRRPDWASSSKVFLRRRMWW